MAENKARKSLWSKLKDLFNKPSQPYANPYLGGVLLGLVLFYILLYHRKRTRRIWWAKPLCGFY